MHIWQGGSVRGLSLTLLCLLAVVYPLFAGAGPVVTRGGGDSPFLLVRLDQLVAGLRAGAFPARWMPDAAYGLGYPFFAFYAALPYYVAAGLCLLGWSPVLAIQVTQALGFLAAAAAMALLARRVLKRPAAVALAVVAYTLAPFHLVNVYVRGDSLSEFYAFVFYPLVFWALLRLHQQPSLQNVAWLALSYGGLILTHNLSAVMFTPFVALYAVYLLLREGLPRAGLGRALWDRARWMLGGGLLGLALSTTLWLGVLGDLDSVWMGNKPIQTTGFFGYEGHFRGANLVQPALAFDYEVGSEHTPFAVGTVQAVLTLLGWVLTIVSWLRGGNWRHTGFWAGGLILSTFLITPLARPLWAHVPVLPLVQFPWRFLSVQAFFGALVVAELAERLPHPWWIAVGCTVLLLAAAVGALRPEYLPVDARDLTPQRLGLFELFTGNIGTTIRGEYLPVAVEPRPYASAVSLNRWQRPGPSVLQGEVTGTTLLSRNGNRERWQVDVSGGGARLAFHTLYYPGWRATIDGQRSQIHALPSSGLIELDVPAGSHVVELELGRPPLRWAADLLSLASLAGALALLFRASYTRVRHPWRRIAFSLAVAALVLGVLWLTGRVFAPPASAAASDDLSMDFDRMPFLHHNPQGIQWGDGVLLTSYAYPDAVAGGQMLTVQLHWAQAKPDLVARLSLLLPSAPHPELQPTPPPLAQSKAPLRETTTALTLAVPEDAPSGLYYLALRVFDGEREVLPVSAQGHVLGTTYLRPVWIDNPRPASSETHDAVTFGEQILLSDDAQIEADEKGWNVKLTWQATQHVTANYAYSLRMLDSRGELLAQRDLEGGAGYGFWPTSAWPVGQWFTDRLRIDAPPGTAVNDTAALRVVLYDRSQPGYPAAGSTVLPLVERAHSYAVPAMEVPVGAVYGDQIELLGYDFEPDQGEQQILVLYWRALRQPRHDWTVFVHLLDLDSQEIATQWDSPPLQGAYLTSWWHSGEVVNDRVTLNMEGVPRGTYRLAIGLYDPDTDNRLPVVTPTGERIPDGRLVLEEAIGWLGP
jgi:hypothetical protein